MIGEAPNGTCGLSLPQDRAASMETMGVCKIFSRRRMLNRTCEQTAVT